MTQVSARREKTRDRLLDAALSVFAERGVQAAAVEEICERAGFTRGAFYSNFESKDDLCLALMQRTGERALVGARETLATIAPRLSASEDVDALLEEAIALFVRTQGRDLEGILAGLELRLHAGRVPELREAYTTLLSQSHATFADLITEALDELGCEWSVPPATGISLLYGVYEQNALDAVIAGREPISTIAPLLVVMLRSMIRERTTS